MPIWLGKRVFWKSASWNEFVLIQKVTQLFMNTKMIIIQGLSELQNCSKDTVWFLLFQTTNCFAFHSFSFRFRGGFWFSTSCYGYTFSIRVVPWSSRKLSLKSSALFIWEVFAFRSKLMQTRMIKKSGETLSLHGFNFYTPWLKLSLNWKYQ